MTRAVPRVVLAVALLAALGFVLAHTAYAGGYCYSYAGMLVCR
jgi:hypothetical protein